jgi:acyl-CoA thioester hydrolase
METFIQPVQIRWSDLDPNFHLRHSVFYDWGALCRIEFLSKYGLTTEVMQQHHFGPIIFREECVFKREIRLGDPAYLTLELTKARKDYSRFTIQHTIMKNEETVAAILTVDIAWLDTVKRKLTIPPQEITHSFSQAQLSENFQWLH